MKAKTRFITSRSSQSTIYCHVYISNFTAISTNNRGRECDILSFINVLYVWNMHVVKENSQQISLSLTHTYTQKKTHTKKQHTTTFLSGVLYKHSSKGVTACNQIKSCLFIFIVGDSPKLLVSYHSS